MTAITAIIAIARETCRHPATDNFPKHPKASIVAKFIVPAPVFQVRLLRGVPAGGPKSRGDP
jgi:hypothetical protein